MVEAEQANAGVWPKVRSLAEQELDGSSLASLEKVCSSEEVCAIWECLRLAFPTKQVWEEVEKQFGKSLILMNGLPDDLVIKEIGRAWKFPEQEADPAYNRHVMGSLGLPAIPLDAVPGEVEGNLWGTHRGVEIRLMPSNFSGLNGVFVGKGRKEQPDSIFTKERLPTLRINVVKDMLTGRRLYVAAGNESWAKELIDKLELEGGTILEMGTWTKGLRKLFSKPLTLKLAGVMLKTMLLHRPGHLGNFTRSFLCCALETFQKSAVELLPMALPPGTAEESKLIELLTETAFIDEPLQNEELERFEQMAETTGAEAWVWLQVLMMNAMYCGGGTARMLTDTMSHSIVWTDAQAEVITRQREYAQAWVEANDEKLTLGEWDEVSEDLSGIYTGAGVGKSYPLTLEAIRPTTPGKGEAGHVDLREVVSEELKPFVETPELLRIPDEELTHPRTTAAVQVTNQDEWDKIVSHLVESEMLEREKPAETLRYKDTPVRNGAFGVHKGWILREDQTWLRTLRLIINLIPSNSFQRRVPSKPSQRMGYGPSWGRLYLHDDEVILCCAEDQKHCFHVYRPGYAWRGYFVLNRKASGAAFHDGNPEAGYPRVRSAPMGWNNVVYFIQDGFETLAKRAQLDPGQMIRMGEASPMGPLTTPRDYFSFYVDNL